jgi:TRAP-type mannitol/chloroaromatic compound transport system permease small subunit
LVGVSYLTGRKLSQFSITPLQELEWHFFFVLVFLTLGAALLADRHVRIDIVRERLPPRARAIIEIVGFFVALLPFCVALVYLGGQIAYTSFVSGERSPAALGLPYRWIIRSCIPLGGALLLMAGIVGLARNLRSLSRR